MNFVLFITVAAISFVGSIQIGLVNLAVMQTTLYRSCSAGMLVAIGGCLPEFIYSFIALKCVVFLQENQFFIAWLNIRHEYVL